MKQNGIHTLSCTHELVSFSQEDGCSESNRSLNHLLRMLLSKALHRCFQDCTENRGLLIQLVNYIIPVECLYLTSRCPPQAMRFDPL